MLASHGNAKGCTIAVGTTRGRRHRWDRGEGGPTCHAGALRCSSRRRNWRKWPSRESPSTPFRVETHSDLETNPEIITQNTSGQRNKLEIIVKLNQWQKKKITRKIQIIGLFLFMRKKRLIEKYFETSIFIRKYQGVFSTLHR